MTKDNLAAEKLKQTFYHEGLRSEIINSESLKNDMDCLLISTVENFKGLEKPIICIFDINEEMESLTLKKFFYNAFSRANHTIFLTCNKKIIEKGLFKYAG
mgnify:FL=1